MQKVVYKYAWGQQAYMRVPRGTIRHVGQQGSSELPTVWIEHSIQDIDSKETMSLQIIGTGHYFEQEVEFCGSAVCGPFVWHVYKEL